MYQKRRRPRWGISRTPFVSGNVQVPLHKMYKARAKEMHSTRNIDMAHLINMVTH